jgi:hypothetical protein
MGIFTDLTVKENMCWPRAAGASMREQMDASAAGSGSSALSGAEEVLELTRPASSAAGRSRCWPWPRDRRAARTADLIDEPSKGLAPSIILRRS